MQRKCVFYKTKKQFVKDSRMDNSYIAGKILVWLKLLIFCFFLYPMTLKKTGFVPVDGWLLLAKIWENEDGGDMVVWAQTGCSAPSEESPALWIGSWCTGEICIHLVIPAGGTDYYLTLILQRPVQRKWDLDIFFSPASFSELLLTSFIMMRSAFRIEYFSVPLSLRWQR